MLQEWRKSWILKGLSSSIAGYCQIPKFPSLWAYFYYLDLSVQHFKGLASSPSLWQQHHRAPKNQVPFHERTINFLSIPWISTPMNLFMWILHQTTPATLILRREPHGSRCLSTLPQLPSCLLPVPSCTGSPEVHGESGKFPPRHEVELFCLQPDKQEGPINWVSCM